MTKRKPLTEEHKQKIREANTGHKVSEETRKKIGKGNKGKIPSEKVCLGRSERLKKNPLNYWLGKKRPPFSKEWKDKIGKSLEGSKSYRWKNGISPDNVKIRTSQEYRYWRKEVFKRDNFTCQKTGQYGGDLVAHHINNFSDFPELRFDINNGITLSKEAHKEFHQKYGIKNNTQEQLIEFINKS